MLRILLLQFALLASVPTARAADYLMLPAVDKAAVAAEDAGRARTGEPYRFALPAVVAVDPAASTTWEDLPGGVCRWQLVVECPGSTSLNLGFSRFRLPWGGRLEIGGHAFTAVDNAAHGQLWTQIVPGDVLTATLTLPAERRDDYELVLAQVGCGYRGLRDEKSGACNVDVVCPEGDAWRAEIDANAVYTLNGTWVCSGSLVNNTARDGAPLFLTANHCDVNAGNAAAMVVYWNFQSPICGQHAGGSLADFQSGAIFRAAYATSDFCLVELEEMPSPASHVAYAGWDRSDADPLEAVAIHHPNTDEKSISFEYQPTTTTTYLTNAVPGNGTHIRIADWDLGTTEPGSSGSPLYDQNHHVVGQLHGGYAACGNDLSDWYGRFSVSWTGGGTPESRLQDWLDPENLGVTTLGLFDPSATSMIVRPPQGMTTTGRAGGPFPATWTYTLTNTGTTALDYEITSSDSWIAATDTAGTLPAGADVEVTFEITASADTLTAGTYEAVVTFADLTTARVFTRDATLVVTPVHLALHGQVPNPAGQNGVLRFDLPAAGAVTLAVFDLRGYRLREISVVGEMGENTLDWTGGGSDNSGLPSGIYVCRLTTPWGTVRKAVTLLN